MTSPSDDELLAAIARLDRPPADLDERVLFAIELDHIDAEVARLAGPAYAGSGARAAERTRTITFEASRRTVMITVVDRADDLVRIDGWLAPGAPLEVELRLPAASRTVVADGAGRFVFDEVPHGLAQLLVHASDGRVVTPSLVL
ncbi:hypothetical protein KOI35_37180 [Actinoplanes bogorensis]|uniref:Carboxypeptidase regulatory-like domain-containing protein n=1 Tax=Paractinoplanes bogorensis TaxID=1610840 RepID=A0ABS5Z0G5_9ACTN|nr:hypothetical protein [Actinoplanes bogorensis]MBU2669162.1 hypothetical protein [Actinoplanes bogorensis]